MGAFIAKELSHYDVKVLVLDKENDFANQTTMANSAIIHSGYDPKPGTLKAKLNVQGNQMYKDICHYYKIPFNQMGSLTVAFDEAGVARLHELKDQATINGVEVELLSAEEVLAQEPAINPTVKMALLAPTASIVYPWQITFALFDHSISNGVEVKLGQEVVALRKAQEGYTIETKSGEEFQAHHVINCAGLFGVEIQKMIEPTEDAITPRKGEYFVLTRGAYKYVNHIIFPLPTERGKGVLAVPISNREILIGPTSEVIDDFDDVTTTKEGLSYLIKEIKNTMSTVPTDRIIHEFAGLRASSTRHDFIIEESKYNTGLYHVIGIESPGLASAPAIAKYLADLAAFEQLPRKTNFKEYQPTTLITKHKQVKDHPDYGVIICHCEHVSRQEIRDAMHGNVGSHTIKGIKKRVRAGFGPCQGGFCEPTIVRLISQEMGISPKEVLHDGPNSAVLKRDSKEIFKT
ncbi:NAD(P)/FAD-dependent oxidoreductase [Entomospira culicis]|uniref:NAD(P)/FAD-dependent oxidoreductase n=1 Tax=Entomospira culicis TaxID=2719989 RepID=A0A968KW60_9SPIO|nr:NAD(P)/FAD-dependent oxidoreductase [Entomospira culicis]NIZ69893.1 NAD(P)/FAD-dependent oxidoreductase [Entomospira culicis]WDI38627.1 NAD(P)/FAD-dependent oxidoreductase [Entomospira culicis]